MARNLKFVFNNSIPHLGPLCRNAVTYRAKLFLGRWIVVGCVSCGRWMLFGPVTLSKSTEETFSRKVRAPGNWGINCFVDGVARCWFANIGDLTLLQTLAAIKHWWVKSRWQGCVCVGCLYNGGRNKRKHLWGNCWNLSDKLLSFNFLRRRNNSQNNSLLLLYKHQSRQADNWWCFFLERDDTFFLAFCPHKAAQPTYPHLSHPKPTPRSSTQVTVWQKVSSSMFASWNPATLSNSLASGWAILHRSVTLYNVASSSSEQQNSLG